MRAPQRGAELAQQPYQRRDLILDLGRKTGELRLEFVDDLDGPIHEINMPKKAYVCQGIF
jgi:hypothetical protein